MRRGLLSEARHLVLPEGIASSSGPAIEATCAKLGIGFDPWQSEFNRCVKAKRADGLYAADTVMLSAMRQVGKTYFFGGDVFADSIIHPGMTTVWTAHQFKVARETFNALRRMAESDRLRPHINPDDIYTASGNESITFRNGSRILFMARERGALRGFSKVRRLILDEGQILTERAMADIIPTMNQAENPQIVLLGTPPKPSDPSEVFSRLRTEALAGTSEGLLYAEFGAPPDVDLDDRKAWTVNPSYPLRTPERAILRLRRMLSDDDFAREALGIWDGAACYRVISIDSWNAIANPNLQDAGGEISVAIDVSPDRSVASIATAAWTTEGVPYVDVIESRRGDPDWGIQKFVDLSSRHQVRAVVIDRLSAANSLIDPLEQRGVAVTATTATQMAKAFGTFVDAVMDGKMRHLDQPALSVALSVARKRNIGDGGFGWSRKDSESDITPLVASTLALWGLTSSEVNQPKRRSGKAMFA
jgi:phage terminase large subunit-like protein